MKIISQFILFAAVTTLATQLLLDPWSEERFERLIRENARLNNLLLHILEKMDTFREAISIAILISIFGYFLNLEFLSKLFKLIVLAFGVILCNPFMFNSQKFPHYFLYLGVVIGLAFKVQINEEQNPMRYIEMIREKFVSKKVDENQESEKKKNE